MEVKKEKLCCYCGTRIATTKDHVPPRSIFNKPQPSDLITVSCCFECNNEASQYDERFIAYLGMHVARQRGEVERLFKESVTPATRHNARLKRKIMVTIEPIYLATKSGIIPRSIHLPVQ